MGVGDSSKLHKMKYNFHEKIKQNSIVELITVINKCWLVEDCNTKNRLWIMEYELEPI
jgi:hypothetical protein